MPELRDLAAEHPLRERLRELLMLALYRCGRQVEALEVYRCPREELVQAFGVEPRPELGAWRRRSSATTLSWPRRRRSRRSQGSRRGQCSCGRDPARLDPLVAVAAPLAGHPPGELVVALLVDDEAHLPEAVTVLAAVRETNDLADAPRPS